MYEVFTLPQLISAFDLSHVTRRKAAVDHSKLDFLNKMTLRRKAGRLDEDGAVVYVGEEKLEDVEDRGGAERDELIRRFQGMLRSEKVLRGW